MPQKPLPPTAKESPPPLMSRRRLLALSGMTFGTLVLAGCSGGSLVKDTGGGGEDFSRAERLVVNPRFNRVADERGVETGFLGFLSVRSGALAAFWGTQDADGTPVRLTQSLFWDDDPAFGARVVFDGQGLPVRVEHEENGAFALLFWESARATFKFYQPDGAYIGGATVTPGGATAGYDVVQLPDSQVVGYYSGRITGLTDAIVTFTVGGNPTTASAAAAVSRGGRADDDTPGVGDALTAEESAQAARVVDALATRASQTQAGFAGDLLKAMADPLIATGQSEIGTRILAAALANTALAPVFLRAGLPILQGLATPFLLRSLAERVKGQLATPPAAAVPTGTTAAQVALGVAYASPNPVGYRSGNAFKTTRPEGDSTGIRGIVASRETDTVPVTGVIDAAGNVFLSGTAANGSVIELRGTLAGGKVAGGRWSLKTAPAPTRDEDGDWDADETPLGQCMETTSSGGQGIFERTVNLGICGDFAFRYEAFSIPDQFQIYQDANLIFTTGGPVSGGGTATVTAVGQTTLIRVVVTADRSGTAWNYTVGCPE